MPASNQEQELGRQTRLSETAFLLAENIPTGRIALKRPEAVYQRSPELLTYFAGHEDAWFIVPHVEGRLKSVLPKLRVASLPRLEEFTPNLSDQQLAERRGGRKSTREESLVNYDLDGLDHFLLAIQESSASSAQLAVAKAISLWNLLGRLYASDNGHRWEGEHRWHYRIEQVRRFLTL